MAQIRAGIFDVGGVLISNEMPHVRRDILETLQVDDAAFAPAWTELSPLHGSGQIDEGEFWRRVIQRTGARGALPEESLFLREYARRYRVHQGVLDLVSSLRSCGMRTAVLSNTITAHVAHNRAQRLFEPFDVLVFSNEVGLSKPDPAIYTLTLERLGMAVEPEAAFFADDREENVAAANAAGIHGLLFTTEAQLLADIRALGVAV